MSSIEALFRDFETYAEECLWVQDKETLRIVRFRFKPVQRRLAKLLVRLYYERRPIRVRILKARREGVSTLVQAFFFWLCATRRDQSAVTISHHDDTTKALHAMSERYYSSLPPFVKPERRQSRRGEVLEFADKEGHGGLQSTMRTMTFKNAGAGQGANLLHRSEVGLWGAEGEQVVGTSEQMVPFAPWSAIIDESTARGYGNLWYMLWCQAEAAERKGDPHGFVPFFIPWFEEPTSVMEKHPPLEDLDAEEEELRTVYGCTDDQLAWRRWIGIPVLCHGDLQLFHQEYPAYPEQAFLATGRPYFDQQVLKDLLDSVDREPSWIGEITETDGMAVVRETRSGPLRIWEAPRDDEDYLLVCDPSEGIAHGDPQAIYITGRSQLATVAAWHGHVERDELGDVLYRLGRLYGTALIAVEVNGGWGFTPIAILRRRGYRRIYQRATETKRKRKSTDTLGWDTTPNLRPIILDKLAEAFRDGDFAVWDRALLEECLHFVVSDSGKPEAQAGYHDDRVIAAALMTHLFQVTHRVRQKTFVPINQKRHALSEVTGY